MIYGLAHIYYDGDNGWVCSWAALKDRATFLIPARAHPLKASVDQLEENGWHCDFRPFHGGWRGYITKVRKRVPDILELIS